MRKRLEQWQAADVASRTNSAPPSESPVSTDVRSDITSEDKDLSSLDSTLEETHLTEKLKGYNFLKLRKQNEEQNVETPAEATVCGMGDETCAKERDDRKTHAEEFRKVNDRILRTVVRSVVSEWNKINEKPAEAGALENA